MPNVTYSTNMNLPIPIVGTDPGPDYGYDINSCLTIIDTHTHASGSGVQITPNGLNINSDLTFQGNDATNLRSTRFSIQSSPLATASDLGCLYVSGVDLYYNDENGTQIRITQSGAVAGTPGSISNLVSPASASYNSGTATFIFESDAATAGNIDGGSLTIREVAASANGVTLSSPVSLAADYTITFPAALPASQKFATLDASGNLAASWAVDNSTVEIATNTLQVKNSGITAAKLASDSVTTAKILDANVTKAKLAALGQQLSSSCGNYSTASASYVDVTNLSVSITVTGRPVMVMMISDGSSITGLGNVVSSAGTVQGNIQALRDATSLGQFKYFANPTGAETTDTFVPSTPVFIDTPAAGTYTYKIQALNNGTKSFYINYYRLLVYEL